MNNGNNKTFSTSGGIGLISTRLTLEVPLIKEKMSFIISGRRTYGDLVARLLFPKDLVSNDMSFYFYDLNSKLNYTINKNNKIFLSGYFGRDVLELGDEIGSGWGNSIGTLRWNHLFSDRLFSNTSLVYSRYNYDFVVGQNRTRFRSGIEDLSLKEDATWYINPSNILKFGGNIIFHTFNTGELSSADSSNYQRVLQEKTGFEGALYLKNEHKITSRLSANYGLRFSSIFQTGTGWFYEYDAAKEPVDLTWYSNG